MIPIDKLPDDVLLAIFGFHMDVASDGGTSLFGKQEIEVWLPLVHVSRRWRSVVFGSPRHLNLRLACTPMTPARDMLGVWPALPVVVWSHVTYRAESVDNIAAALERSDRVCQISLVSLRRSQLENVLAALQKQFPELTHLELYTHDTVQVLFDSLLGGYAPRLQLLRLQGIPLPGLPTLLLSATHLVNLHLYDIPHSGYMSPEAMVSALSTLANLRSLLFEFQSPRSRPDQACRRPPPSTRSVLPILTFCFRGVNEYLEDIVARIDAPQLDLLSIDLFNDIVFETPQLFRFICRTPTLKGFGKARVCFGDYGGTVNLFSQPSGQGELFVTIRCGELDWSVSSLEQVITSCFPPLSILEDLYIFKAQHRQPHWQDNVENTLWLEILHPFSAVKNLYLCEEFAPRIVPALQELVVGRATEVLPALENIFLESLQESGPVQEGIAQFVATRQVAGYPTVVSRWEGLQLDMAPRTRFLPAWGSRRAILNTVY